MANVLILDDEEILLKIIAVYLSRSGHRAIPCSSPGSAIRQFKEARGAIDLLISDVTLGRASGVEIGFEFLAEVPSMRALFISGYPVPAWKISDAALLHTFPSDAVRVLEKPFTALDLLLKVDELVGHLAKGVSLGRAAAAGPAA
jgi:DNA-binding NtrC family response regulator